MSNGKLGFSNTSSKKKCSNCTICRDIFKMPQEVYSTHRGNSSKCPNNKNKTSSSSQLHIKVKLEPPTTNDSPNNTSNQSKGEYISNNNSTQNSTINNNNEESPTIIVTTMIQVTRIQIQTMILQLTPMLTLLMSTL